MVTHCVPVSLIQKQQFNCSTAQQFCGVCTHDVDGFDNRGEYTSHFCSLVFIFVFDLPPPCFSQAWEAHGQADGMQSDCVLPRCASLGEHALGVGGLLAWCGAGSPQCLAVWSWAQPKTCQTLAVSWPLHSYLL